MSTELTTQGGALALREDELLAVLQSSLYPGAAPDSIRMVLGYCKASGLDPMQKPVHIVPMWDSKASRMRDVVMPGIGLYRTQASRTGQYVGKSEPEYGPMLTEVIGGMKITFPEWAKVTVKRIVGGMVAEFTATEYWMENYAVKGGKEKSVAPNAMWAKRPRGQIAKCATAQALREAFPELGSQATAEEMEGGMIQAQEEPSHQSSSPARIVADAAAECITEERRHELDDCALTMLDAHRAGNDLAALELYCSLTDSEEKLYVWGQLRGESALRSFIKANPPKPNTAATEVVDVAVPTNIFEGK